MLLKKYFFWRERVNAKISHTRYIVNIHLRQRFSIQLEWKWFAVKKNPAILDSKVHGAHLRPTGPRWAPRWPHEGCYRSGIRSLQNCVHDTTLWLW